MLVGGARSATYDFGEGSFLVGGVPGCDLRLPGSNLPPVICLLSRRDTEVVLRKLAPTFPVLVNGQPIAQTVLKNQDRISLGSVDLRVHLATGVESLAKPQAASHSQPNQTIRFRMTSMKDEGNDDDERTLHQRTEELEADRVIWYRRREQIEAECKKQEETLAIRRRELDQRAHQLGEQQRALDDHAKRLGLEQQELGTLREELNELHKQLYERYRQRRDRLSGLEEAVRRAARNVQEQKRLLAADGAAVELVKPTPAQNFAEGTISSKELEQSQRQLEAKCQDLEQREQHLAAELGLLRKNQAQYQLDLVRLMRFQGDVEEREKRLLDQDKALQQKAADLDQAEQELEEQTRKLDERQSLLLDEVEKLTQRKTEHDDGASQLAQRSAVIEGQQAMLATLRTRLERMREECRREEQHLVAQRERQEITEAELQKQSQEMQRLRTEMEAEQRLFTQQRQVFEERSQVMEEAVARLRHVQDTIAAEQEQLRVQKESLDATAAQQTEETELLRARTAQLTELQLRLATDHQALRDRETSLGQAEQAREALQEQLRRRAEDLNGRQKQLAEQTRRLDEEKAALEQLRAELERQRQESDARAVALRGELEQLQQQGHASLADLRNQLETRAGELESMRGELERRERQWHDQTERLRRVGRLVASQRKAVRAAEQSARVELRAAEERILQARAECEAAREEAAEILRQWPELEQHACGALERLGQAREQLRSHLGELHGYARQSHDDVEKLRQQLQTQADQLRDQERSLVRERDDHRLSVVAFRQQLIEWQGQLSELKRSLADGENRLERRQAEVDQQARQIDATFVRLSKQAEELEQQQRVVAERRGEMETHLADMREWYRRKLRELTERRRDGSAERTALSAVRGIPEASEIAPTARDILSLTGDLDPGDRQLGDLLRSADLIDADTLTTLLVEARKQRRTLRQLLLSGGYLTLYQLALIEAGNLDALMLGPVRVVDRVRVTPRETVYRVFDPRRGEEVVLRLLSEAEAQDAVHPDEFRQRFAAAVQLQHPNVAATFEVLAVKERPAATQEWCVGLPSGDWPELVAVPGVLYRLVSQVAQGLHAAHQAGLTHGHLNERSIVLTADGVVKVLGVGEPPWLIEPPISEAAFSPEEDLAALGRLTEAWVGANWAKKLAKAKTLLALLQRLHHENPNKRYANSTDLLADLDRIAADVPANPEAWDRLLKHVRENGTAELPLRRTA